MRSSNERVLVLHVGFKPILSSLLHNKLMERASPRRNFSPKLIYQVSHSNRIVSNLRTIYCKISLATQMLSRFCLQEGKPTEMNRGLIAIGTMFLSTSR